MVCPIDNAQLVDIDYEIPETNGRFGRDPMKSIAWIKIQPFTSMLLSCNAFIKYISIKSVYFDLKYYGLFLNSKTSNLITACKLFHITVLFMKSVMWQW